MSRGWIIFICMTVFNNSLMLLPLSFELRYTDRLYAKVSYLMISYQIIPKKEKKSLKKRRKKQRKKEQEEQQQAGKKSPIKEYFEKAIKKRGVGGFIELVTGLASLAVGTVAKILSKVVLKDFDIALAIASDDAAQTALNYGKACAAVYPAVNVLISACKCKNYGITVQPDFDSEKSRVRFFAKGHIMLGALVFQLAKAGIALVKQLRVRK